MFKIALIYRKFYGKFLLALFLFSLCRLLFYFFNHSYFSEVEFLNFTGGIRFDWMAITILYLPFWVLHLILFKGGTLAHRLLFHLFNSLALALNILDLEYFKFTFKRTTFDLIGTAGLEQDLFNLAPHFMRDYWYLLLIFTLLVWLSDRLYCWIDRIKIERQGPVNYLLFFVPTLVFLFVGFRGGLQYKPLNVIQAGQYAPAQNIPLVLNTPFTMLKSAYKEELPARSFYATEELSQHFSPILSIHGDSVIRQDNVVLIILEGFSREYIGALQGGKSYTPFLDSLIGESLEFENAYANGKKSIEALPSILAGIPTLMNTSYIASKYATNPIMALPRYLHNKGYQTLFYHGGENGTMGFDAFAELAGVEEYLGKDQYPHKNKDYDGSWGIFDEPFLQFCANDLKRREQPFFATIFTLSSHHPYSIPEEYQDRFEEGPLPILKSIQYADLALRHFFETAAEEDWYENTLFVVTADHTAQSMSPEYGSRSGIYAIPLVFFHPRHLQAERRKILAQQNDIFPTVVDWLGYEDSLLVYGNSLLDTAATHYVVNYINDSYQLMQGNYVIHFDGSQVIGAYNRLKDPALMHNLAHEDAVWQRQLSQKLKALIQDYNQRLIRNQLLP
jgi:arylsulfatase A-like enzyme